MALKIFKWKLNNLTKARFEKKNYILLLKRKKLALELTIVGLKILLYREIIFKSIK